MPNTNGATVLAPDANGEWLYDPSYRTAAAFVTLCEAALVERPGMPAADRARYEALIEQAEAVLLLGDVLIERGAREHSAGEPSSPWRRRFSVAARGATGNSH
jgi:hypothetical protein